MLSRLLGEGPNVSHYHRESMQSLRGTHAFAVVLHTSKSEQRSRESMAPDFNPPYNQL